MNSTVSKSNGEKPSIPPIFSYAQAAKGRPAATAALAAQVNYSSTPSSIPSTRDLNSIVSTPSQSSLKEDRSATESFDTLSRFEAPTEVTIISSKGIRFEPGDSPPQTPGLGPVSGSSPAKDDDKDDEFVLVGNTPTSTHEQNSTGKKGKKQKSTSNDVEKEDVKSEVLVPAPLPVVNFWQQRKEKLAKSTPPQLNKSSKTSADTIFSSDGQPRTTNKNIESKKRSKQSAVDNNEITSDLNQNGVTREVNSTGRALKKGENGSSRLKDEHLNKRNGIRGNKHVEKDEKSSNIQAPPPVEDAKSWPTPETVLMADKRKVQEKQERDEKDDTTTNKPRQKEKWVPVPYIPTVTFSTPIPSRGGRARGGARSTRIDHDIRSNHGLNGMTASEKIQTISTESTNLSSESDRSGTRESLGITSAPGTRRQSGEIPNTRRSSMIYFADKARANPPKSENHYQNESHHASKFAQSGHNTDYKRDLRNNTSENSHLIKNEQSEISDVSTIVTTERRMEINLRQSEHNNFGKEHRHQSRERTDGRTDRGRSSFRGRGGHSNYTNGHSHQSNYSNGTSNQYQNGYNLRHGPYSPPLIPPFSTQFVPPTRASRTGPRPQSIQNSNIYGRFSQNGGGISQPLTSIQTSPHMYDYAPMQPVSASPYQPYIDQVSVFTMVTMQLEYYFSIDNLCKDVYLRKHMDSQGFVFLSFIAGFKRIVALTQDFELIRFACQESEIIELVRGGDGIDRIRRREGWEKWVLTVEEREDSTKNSNTNFWQPPQYAQKPQYVRQMILTNPHPSCMVSYSASETSYHPCSKDGPTAPSLNRTDAYQIPTPLSAAVPDFAPGLPQIDSSNELLEAETTFHEDEVPNLTLVFTSPDHNHNDPQTRTSYYNSSSRTFSNGSIDRRSISEGLYEDSPNGNKPLMNGQQDLEVSSESRSRPSSSHSITRSCPSNGPPVMWVKGHRQQVPISDRNSQELYITFRARALKNRENSLSISTDTHPDMKLLYEFWSHFLCRNFNSQMYSEFRRFAFEDARSGHLNGMNNLLSYYDEILNSKKKVIPEILARHYIDLVALENFNGRPAFKRLRAAWRNSALDLKSRKRIDSLISPGLRQELEQAPHQQSDLL